MKTRMAGDRGLAFVVVGLIGVSALIILNHGHIGPASRTVHAAGIVSEPAALSPASLGFEWRDSPKPAASAGHPEKPGLLQVYNPAAPDQEFAGDSAEFSWSGAEFLPRSRQPLPLESEWLGIGPRPYGPGARP